MKKRPTLLLLFTILSIFLCSELSADNSSIIDTTTHNTSKRIEVYSISQNFWDVNTGDTLGEIVNQLLPDNPGKRKALLLKIISLNPDAFIQNSPDQLKDNVRLWLPNSTPVLYKAFDKNKYDIQSFSWGQVYKIKR